MVQVEPLSSTVGEGLGRLEDHKALLGMSEVDAASFQLSDDRVEIGPRVATEQRELEAAASDGCS